MKSYRILSNKEKFSIKGTIHLDFLDNLLEENIKYVPYNNEVFYIIVKLKESLEIY